MFLSQPVWLHNTHSKSVHNKWLVPKSSVFREHVNTIFDQNQPHDSSLSSTARFQGQAKKWQRKLPVINSEALNLDKIFYDVDITPRVFWAPPFPFRLFFNATAQTFYWSLFRSTSAPVTLSSFGSLWCSRKVLTRLISDGYVVLFRCLVRISLLSSLESRLLSSGLDPGKRHLARCVKLPTSWVGTTQACTSGLSTSYPQGTSQRNSITSSLICWKSSTRTRQGRMTKKIWQRQRDWDT